ncbi:MAG TPA: alpha/beta hydrolase [Gammaproteobacteria bacterium]|nr:alpha/beta hydrolase [Gammaproteobacteria bacterium]
MALVGIPRDLNAPTVVIVHGAWADVTGWREVIALLQVKGVSVVAVQNPLSALAEDVHAVTRALNRQLSPIVLVGHGYGGTVITQAGNHQGVAALVYVAAYAPDVGESTADVEKDHLSPSFIARFEVDASGYLYLPPDAVLEFLAHDLPATEGLVLAAAQPPIRASALLDRVTEAAWHTKPSWYAVTDQDRLISPTLQREIASRINASVFVLRAGHAAFLSKPKETADVILAAVGSAQQGLSR